MITIPEIIKSAPHTPITEANGKFRTTKPLLAPEGYSPNWNDSRVRAAAYRAVNFVQSNMKPGKPRALGQTLMLTPHFGQKQTPMCEYLMSVLLEVYDSYYSKDAKRAMQFTMRPEGVKLILEKLGIKAMTEEESKQYFIETAKETYKEDIKHIKEGTLQYTQKSHRRWNRFQNVVKETKQALLADAGFYYMYDIECCAPTLLYQYAQSLGLDEYKFHISEYIKHRTQVRNMLAYDTGIPVEKIKVIINATFAGGKLGRSAFFDTSRILDYDFVKITALKEHPFIIELKKEIASMWNVINKTINRRFKQTPKGGSRMCQVTSREKWDIYFCLESKVLDSVINYCETNGHRTFLEHDGWCTSDYIPPELLIEHIFRETGYHVKLDLENISTKQETK